MTLEEAARQYVEAKEALTRCMETHEKLCCFPCRYYKNCQVQFEYAEAWTRLQKVYKNA